MQTLTQTNVVCTCSTLILETIPNYVITLVGRGSLAEWAFDDQMDRSSALMVTNVGIDF